MPRLRPSPEFLPPERVVINGVEELRRKLPVNRCGDKAYECLNHQVHVSHLVVLKEWAQQSVEQVKDFGLASVDLEEDHPVERLAYRTEDHTAERLACRTEERRLELESKDIL